MNWEFCADFEDSQGMNHHFGDSLTLSPVTKAATKLLNVLTIIERNSASRERMTEVAFQCKKPKQFTTCSYRYIFVVIILRGLHMKTVINLFILLLLVLLLLMLLWMFSACVASIIYPSVCAASVGRGVSHLGSASTFSCPCLRV